MRVRFCPICGTTFAPFEFTVENDKDFVHKDSCRMYDQRYWFREFSTVDELSQYHTDLEQALETLAKNKEHLLDILNTERKD